MPAICRCRASREFRRALPPRSQAPPASPERERVNPETEDDYEWDVGVVHQLTKGITVSEDAFYEYTKHYLDTGQFGDVPIFAPFNYKHGYIWGTETAITYNG